MDVLNSTKISTIKSFGAWAALTIFACYFIVKLAVELFAMLALRYFSSSTELSKIGTEVLSLPVFDTGLILILGALVSFFVVFELMKPYFPGSIKLGAYAPLGWAGCSATWCWGAAGFGAFLSLFYSFIVYPNFPPDDDYTPGFIVSALSFVGWQKLLVVFSVIVLAPIVEEFLYRGVLYTGFAKSFGKIISGFLVTILFVLMHLTQYGGYWLALLAIASVSVATLIVRELKGSLVPAIFLHSGANFASVVLTYLV